MEIKNTFRLITASLLLSILFVDTTFSYAHPGEQKERTVMLSKNEEVSFKDNKGNVVSLNQLKGKVVLINLWATWCSPCLAEMPSLDKLYKDFLENSQIVFLSVDVDGNLKSSAKFLKKRKYSLPLYQLNSALPKEWSTTSIPTTIILDKVGKLVNKHVGGMNFGSVKFREALKQLTEE
ncbi:TlpA disulfide reductase family protein [Sphingobacterium sp. HMA12]|uniref:TlpA family protein disulfide reductase n=1 Tax=Sphingobacterium sp. HMA12 TaxID=2050894 RepID=UPI000CE9CC38|nr:TlpA disulfide reductase family protein [Sphingobacterium sp. HMA12]